MKKEPTIFSSGWGGNSIRYLYRIRIDNEIRRVGFLWLFKKRCFRYTLERNYTYWEDKGSGRWCKSKDNCMRQDVARKDYITRDRTADSEYI